MIQDILVRDLGALYKSGSLNHPALAKERRELILTRAYREARDEFDHKLLKMTTLIGDSTLADAVKSCLDALKDAHVRFSHS